MYSKTQVYHQRDFKQPAAQEAKTGEEADKDVPRYASQLTRDENNLVEAPETIKKDSNFVVQKYIKSPALWKGHKFDFRIYVLVTSVIDPMTIFLY